jgi:hypothetical protein
MEEGPNNSDVFITLLSPDFKNSMYLIISKSLRLAESVYDIKSVFHFSLQILFQIFFDTTNIYGAASEMNSEPRVALYVKRPLFSP